MNKKKSVIISSILSAVTMATGFYFYKLQSKDRALYEKMNVCDWLYILAPEKTHNSRDSGVDNKIKIMDAKDNKIAEIAYERKAAGKFSLIEVKNSKKEIFPLLKSTGEYSGFYFDHGNTYVPPKCAKVTFLDIRTPDKVELRESADPSAVSQLTQ